MVTREPSAARIVVALGATATALVLLLGYRTSSPPGPLAALVATSAGTTSTGTASTGTTSTGTTSTGTTTTGKAAPAEATSYDGAVVATRWGPVQVRITVGAGTVVAVEAVQVPDENRHDREINARAVPVLDAEALAAQSADIDTVSGATVTSRGYVASLQSALDAADL